MMKYWQHLKDIFLKKVQTTTQKMNTAQRTNLGLVSNIKVLQRSLEVLQA